MNRITSPLEQGMRGPEVASLQDALRLLLDRAAILADDAATRNDLLVGLRRERAETIYEQVTRRIVSVFQEEQRLEPHGMVDEPTANALNACWRSWGRSTSREPASSGGTCASPMVFRRSATW